MEIPDLATLGRLICVDGSVFPAVANMLWAEYTSKHQAIRLHLGFELNRMIPAHFLVDAGNSNEKKALVQMLEAGVTYIADRGYLRFALLAIITTAEAFFVVRAKANLVYKRMEKLRVDLPASVQHLFRHVTDQRVRLKNAKGRPIYRLIKFWVGEEQYLILTNRLDLTTFQVILLYAYRWQVELVFRFLKRSKACEMYHSFWGFCCSVGPIRLSAPLIHTVSLAGLDFVQDTTVSRAAATSSSMQAVFRMGRFMGCTSLGSVRPLVAPEYHAWIARSNPEPSRPARGASAGRRSSTGRARLGGSRAMPIRPQPPRKLAPSRS
jgi:hypothetical protein